jgi:hypothetical protein
VIEACPQRIARKGRHHQPHGLRRAGPSVTLASRAAAESPHAPSPAQAEYRSPFHPARPRKPAGRTRSPIKPQLGKNVKGARAPLRLGMHVDCSYWYARTFRTVGAWRTTRFSVMLGKVSNAETDARIRPDLRRCIADPRERALHRSDR